MMLYTWLHLLFLMPSPLNNQGTDGLVTSVKLFLYLLIQSNHNGQQKGGYIPISYGRSRTISLKSFRLAIVHNAK